MAPDPGRRIEWFSNAEQATDGSVRMDSEMVTIPICLLWGGGGELDLARHSVALLIDDRPAFQAKAHEVSERFGSAAIPEL